MSFLTAPINNDLEIVPVRAAYRINLCRRLPINRMEYYGYRREVGS